MAKHTPTPGAPVSVRSVLAVPTRISLSRSTSRPASPALAGDRLQRQHGLDSSRSGGLSALSPRERAGGEGKENEVDLCDLAYTLQTGREPLEERLAVIVSGMVEAVDMLSRFHAGERTIAGLYRGNARKDKAGLPASDASAVADLLHNRALTELARLWVAGLEVHWRPLYGAEQPARLSLPTYPF